MENQKVKFIDRLKKRLNDRIEKVKKADAKDYKNFFINNAIFFVIFGLIIVIIVMEPTFLSSRVAINILTQSSVKLILALGVGGIIILQGTDLSLGRSVGFAAIISASFLQDLTSADKPYFNTLPEWFVNNDLLYLLLPLMLAMLVTAIFSALNGVVVSVFKVHPFLATLGSSVALYGLLQMYFESGAHGPQPIGSLSQRFSDVANYRVTILGNDFPILIFYAIIITIIMWVVWNKTRFGKNMYAVGGNPEAANISGVSVVKTTVLVYILAGLLYGLGGYLEVARIGSASSGIGTGYELDAIAACVVGGISFSGGIGKISGAVAGVLMFTIISYGMIYVGIAPFYQFIVKGVIIVAAVAVDTRKYIKKT